MYRRKIVEFLESYRNIITNPDDYTTRELESLVQKEIEDRELNAEGVWRYLKDE